MKALRSSSKEFRAKGIARQKESVHRLQKTVFEFLLEHPCVDCGIKDPRCLEFDHVSGKKEIIISRAKHLGSPRMLAEEMAKCEVRCTNCHRKKSGKDQKHHKHEGVDNEIL